jgi:hypothetical protein
VVIKVLSINGVRFRHPPSTMRYAILVWCWWCGFF